MIVISGRDVFRIAGEVVGIVVAVAVLLGTGIAWGSKGVSVGGASRSGVTVGPTRVGIAVTGLLQPARVRRHTARIKRC